MAIARIGITPEELSNRDNEWLEVVNGELVAMDTDSMGLVHTIIIHNLYDVLKPYAKAHNLGYVHADGLKYILAVDDDGNVIAARTPDLAFIRRGNVPKNFDRTQPFPGAPDLAVEVASPGQTSAELLAKVADFLKYGSEEVWMIYPVRAELHQFRRDEQAARIYRAVDTLDAGNIFPGLVIVVQELFRDDVE